MQPDDHNPGQLLEDSVDRGVSLRPRKSLTRMLILSALKIAFVVVVVLVLLLLWFQRTLIYIPRPYKPDERESLPSTAVRIDYKIAAGRQTAFYIPPKNVATATTGTQIAGALSAPKRLWVFFNGNAMLSLDWLQVIFPFPDPDVGILLFDYPGYGDNAGAPSRRAIMAGADAAFVAFREKIQPATSRDSVELNVVGISLGCAVALEFAANHPPRRIILFSPFTNLLEMARRTVGWPLNYLLFDRFDNRASLATIAASDSPPKIELFHGTRDEIVPFAMGRTLADSHPAMITFHTVEGGNHNDIVFAVKKQFRKMLEPTN